MAGGCCNDSLYNNNLKPETTTTPPTTTTSLTTNVITTDKTTALPTTQGVTTHDPSKDIKDVNRLQSSLVIINSKYQDTEDTILGFLKKNENIEKKNLPNLLQRSTHVSKIFEINEVPMLSLIELT